MPASLQHSSLLRGHYRAMRSAAGILLLLITAPGFAQSLTNEMNTCVIDGVTYTNILDVRADSSGGIVIMHKAGAIKVKGGDLSGDFLKSWGISPSSILIPDAVVSTNQHRFGFANNSGEPTALVQMLSPKVRELIEQHIEVKQLLTDISLEATTNRSLVVYSFYSDDPAAAMAYHFSPDAKTIVIAVSENLQPVDQLIQLVFEMINSERDDKIQAICEQATLGRLGRQDFAVAVVKEEFAAYPKLLAFLSRLRLSKQEMEECVSYEQFVDAPQDFEAFVSYEKTGSLKGRDIFKEYEAKYDALFKP